LLKRYSLDCRIYPRIESRIKNFSLGEEKNKEKPFSSERLFDLINLQLDTSRFLPNLSEFPVQKLKQALVELKTANIQCS
jgi:hypothetical protein